MAWIHHPALDVDVDVPAETVEIWCGEPGWRPGTRECPEPWEPQQQLDENGDPIAPIAPEVVETPSDPTPTARKRAAASAPTGDTNTTPTQED